MATTGKRRGRGSLAYFRGWESASSERMDRAVRRRYLERQLQEIEMLIDYIMSQRQGDASAYNVWDARDSDSDLWGDMMDLNYLEASRHAILATLSDLSRPA